MTKINKYQKGGAIKTVIIVVAILIVLKYLYEFDVIGDLSNGKFKYVLDKFYAFGQAGWSKWSYLVFKVWDFVKGLFFQIISKVKM